MRLDQLAISLLRAQLPRSTLHTMKAILQATLAASLSGIHVGVLLKKKVSQLGATPESLRP